MTDFSVGYYYIKLGFWRPLKIDEPRQLTQRPTFQCLTKHVSLTNIAHHCLEILHSIVDDEHIVEVADAIAVEGAALGTVGDVTDVVQVVGASTTIALRIAAALQN